MGSMKGKRMSMAMKEKTISKRRISIGASVVIGRPKS